MFLLFLHNIVSSAGIKEYNVILTINVDKNICPNYQPYCDCDKGQHRTRPESSPVCLSCVTLKFRFFYNYIIHNSILINN